MLYVIVVIVWFDIVFDFYLMYEDFDINLILKIDSCCRLIGVWCIIKIFFFVLEKNKWKLVCKFIIFLFCNILGKK